jgi:hypothetical protein
MNTQIEFDEDLNHFGLDEFFYRKTNCKQIYSSVLQCSCVEKNLYPIKDMWVLVAESELEKRDSLYVVFLKSKINELYDELHKSKSKILEMQNTLDQIQTVCFEEDINHLLEPGSLPKRIRDRIIEIKTNLINKINKYMNLQK